MQNAIRRFDAGLSSFICSPSEDVVAFIMLPKLAKR